MTDYTQETLFFTKDEVTALREADALQNAHQAQRSKDNLIYMIGENVVEVFKEFIESGTITANDAFAIYESMAHRLQTSLFLGTYLGWDTANPFITKKFTVTVSYNGTDIAEFNDIEAEDEDSANDHVANNLSVDDVEVTLTVSLDGNQTSGEVNTTYEFDESDLEFEATEQD